jgi:hypothetical protein
MIQKYIWKEFIEENNPYNVNILNFERIVNRLPRLSTDVYIAGGSLCDVLSSRKPKDIDIFFSNEVARYEFQKTFKRQSYGITTIDLVYRENSKIILGYQTIEERVNNADFTVTQFVYDGTYLYCGEHSLEDLKDKLLINNNFREVDYKKRAERYRDKGYTEAVRTSKGILTGVKKAEYEYRNEIAKSKRENEAWMKLAKEFYSDEAMKLVEGKEQT